jgi:hypothetical protein
MLIAWTFGFVHDVLASWHWTPDNAISFADGDELDFPISLD